MVTDMSVLEGLDLSKREGFPHGSIRNVEKNTMASELSKRGIDAGPAMLKRIPLVTMASVVPASVQSFP